MHIFPRANLGYVALPNPQRLPMRRGRSRPGRGGPRRVAAVDLLREGAAEAVQVDQLGHLRLLLVERLQDSDQVGRRSPSRGGGGGVATGRFNTRRTSQPPEISSFTQPKIVVGAIPLFKKGSIAPVLTRFKASDPPFRHLCY